MRRGALVVAALALAGCSGPETVGEVEQCLRDSGAQVSRPDARERTSPPVPARARFVVRASWRGGDGAARVFLAPDEPSARAAQEELREIVGRAGVPPDAVRRDASWLLFTQASERETKLAFYCIR